jgi:hypothetical protein
MPLLFRQLCPYSNCENAHRVFVNEEIIPPAGTEFEYYCPGCARRVVCHPSLYIEGVEIPSAAVIARRANSPV